MCTRGARGHRVQKQVSSAFNDVKTSSCSDVRETKGPNSKGGCMGTLQGCNFTALEGGAGCAGVKRGLEDSLEPRKL